MKLISKSSIKYIPTFSLLFFSYSAFFGGILGYFLSEGYTKKISKKFKLPKSLFLGTKNLKIKIHHWIWASGLFFSAIVFQIKTLSTPFSLGCLFGVLWHDLVNDPNRFKIIFKNGSHRNSS